jgi:hypothetical protein
VRTGSCVPSARAAKGATTVLALALLVSGCNRPEPSAQNTPVPSPSPGRLAAAPSSLKLETTASTIRAVWAPPVTTRDGPVTGYRVYIDADEAIELPATARSYTFKELYGGSWHIVHVAARTAAGVSAIAQEDATLPVTPAAATTQPSATATPQPPIRSRAPVPAPRTTSRAKGSSPPRPKQPGKVPTPHATRTVPAAPTMTVAGTIEIPYKVDGYGRPLPTCGGLQEFATIQVGSTVRVLDPTGQQVASGRVTSCNWRPAGSRVNIPGTPSYNYFQPVLSFGVPKMSIVTGLLFDIGAVEIRLGSEAPTMDMVVSGCRSGTGLCVGASGSAK